MPLQTSKGNQFQGNHGHAVGLGMLIHQTRVTALGHNPSIDTASTPEDVWEGGGLYPFQTSAQTLEVVSSSANDAAAGTGTRSVTVIGLDANYVQISEVVVLNGVTPVATTKQYLRVNTFTQASVGSGGINAGDLTLRVSGAGATQALMKAGYGFARQCVYTVPANSTLFIMSLNFSVVSPAGAGVNAAVFARWSQSSTGIQIIPIEFNVTSTNPYLHPAELGIVVAQKTDFTIRVTSVSQNSTNLMANVEAVLYGNDVSGT